MSASQEPMAVPRDDLAWHLLQEMSEAVILVDLQSSTILESNASTETLTGWSRAELVGQPADQIILTPERRPLSDWLNSFSATASDNYSSAPFALLTSTNDRLPVQASVREARSAEQKIAIFIARQKRQPRPDAPPSRQIDLLAEDSEFKGTSETQRLQLALARSEEKFHQLFEESPLALMELDWSEIREELEHLQNSEITDLAAWLEENPDEIARLSRLSRISEVNRRTLELFKASSIDEFMGNIGSLLRQDSLPAFRDHLMFRLKGGRTFNRENIAYTVTGERVYIHVSATAPSSDDPWNPVYASLTDITKRKHAQLLRDGQRQVLEKLASGQSVESTLRTLAAELEQQSPYLRAAVFQTTPDGQSLKVIAEAETAQEVVTLISSGGIGGIFPDPSAPHEVQLTSLKKHNSNRVSESIRPSVIELLTHVIGICGYESGVLKPIVASSGHLLGVLAVFRCEDPTFTSHEVDVISSFTDLSSLVITHDQRRRALVARTAELQSVFETYPDALLRIASDGSILEHYSGIQLSELLHLSDVPHEQVLWQLLPHDAVSEVRTAINSVNTGSPQETVEFTVNNGDDRRHYEARFLPLPSFNEQMAVIRDVTRLKQAELALEYASERFRYLFENSPDAIFVESPDGIVLNANQAACTLHLLSREQLVGQNVLNLIPEADHETANSRVEALFYGKISEFESRSLRSDGEIVPVGLRISTITYDGEPALLLHVRDITQQKKEEKLKREQDRQIAHVSRLTMMGQLVAGIAHEIRQPLWSLTNFADVCVEALDRPDYEERMPQIRDFASKLVTEARRVTAITTRMFAFARNGKPERETSDISEIINDAVELTSGYARSNRIKTTVQLARNIPLISCDRVLIEQTLANLLNNAYTALASHPSDSRMVAIEGECSPNCKESISISVSDNGPGLPDEINPEQLFEGFFTTGQSGLGIGLALSRSFVEDHGGEIRAETLSAGGMRFTFTLRVDGGSPTDAD